MREELDCIPREDEGVRLPLAWIEACSRQDYVVKRWSPPFPGFVDMSEAHRRFEMQSWLDREIAPILTELKQIKAAWALGGDFAMRQDRADYAFGYPGENLARHVPPIVEQRDCHYAQQKPAGVWIRDTPWLRTGVEDPNR